MSSRPHRVLHLATAICVASTAPALAQHASIAGRSPVVLHSLHSETIPSIVGVVDVATAPTNGPPAACTAKCVESTVNVRANTRWQLQVTLNQSLEHASIEWIDAASAAHQLVPGAYLTVASSNEPTFQRAVSVLFNVRNDAGSAPLGASQLASVVSYRVVPLP